tara:strand:+ start:9059 stop:10186 length:1128 start_codon:yes stop_codon:yes gene_type:complete
MVTDAWRPHLSGVLRVVESLAAELAKNDVGHTIVHPQEFPGVPLPGYGEIKIALPIFFRKTIDNLVKKHGNVAIHIMTEGPLGLTMRNYCVARGLNFTTSFHTHWHKYMRVYLKVPQRITMLYIQDFHRPAERVLVPSEETKQELKRHGFKNEIVVCENGVDTHLFRPRKKKEETLRPHMLYVGRVSKEKNIEDFLKVQVLGSKKVVGDGPILRTLERKYPDVEFSGPQQGDELARSYADADVFVFPSKTDTFGVVLLEALASGVPVAAYPAPGPNTIIRNEKLGALNTNMEKAIQNALDTGDSDTCVAYAEQYSWKSVSDIFVGSLVPIGAPITMPEAIKNHLLRIPREFYRLFTHAGYAQSLLFGSDKHERKK